MPQDSDEKFKVLKTFDTIKHHKGKPLDLQKMAIRWLGQSKFNFIMVFNNERYFGYLEISEDQLFLIHVD